MTPLEAALALLRQGFSVFPAHNCADGQCSCGRDDCGSPGKHPRVAWTTFQRRLATEEEVRRWWSRWPQANVAMATGTVSGIIVLDVDPRHGGDDSLASFAPLPRTMTALTGGGGMHLFFDHPGSPTPNGANLLPGIDLRGDGGYVIVPPSIHQSGRAYEWEVEAGPGEIELVPIPERVALLIQSFAPTFGAAAETPAPSFDLDAIIAAGIPDGTRNVTLTRVAGHFASQGMDSNAVLMATLGVNETACRPPKERAEIETIVKSIMGREERRRAAAKFTDTVVAQNGDNLEFLSDEERLIFAREIWRRQGISCLDWYVLHGIEEPEYILETPEREVRIGDDLLNYTRMRRRMLNVFHILMPKMKNDVWEPIALQMAKAARETITGPTNTTERVAEWLEEYGHQAREWDMGARRDALQHNPVLYEGKLAFKVAALLGFIEVRFGEKLGVHELGNILRRGGAVSQVIRVSDTERTRVWLYQVHSAD